MEMQASSHHFMNKHTLIFKVAIIFFLFSCIIHNLIVPLQTKSKYLWIMTFLNQFHKEVTMRKMRKIAESQQSPMNSTDFANYMKRNLELAKQM